MKTTNDISNYTFLSHQTKRALIYAIQEVKENKLNVLTSKYMMYGILKAYPSLLSNNFKSIGGKNKIFNEDINYLIYKCKLSLKDQKTQSFPKDESKKIILSKTITDLFTSLFTDLEILKLTNDSIKNYNVITTFSIFYELLKNDDIKTWFKDEIFLQKK
uniref:N-domain of Clp chaperone n=1 Tax=Pseudellipsoidion edaphicum TaxID=1431838 RepID=A0A410D2T1_9STRA|nr:N-domain of Clp chaperone [Pseudellipsoidion edaphicum]QAA12045.1 N-domain of Clp chaperone [Pseudellipsoidion edaphicum]